MSGTLDSNHRRRRWNRPGGTTEVADILHVSPKTVARWAKDRKLPFLKTLGGHRRYPAAKIRHPAAHPRPGTDQPPPPAGGGPADPGPPGLGGWTPPEVDGGDPEVARLLAVLTTAGPAGLTVTELVVATGRQKTWVYERLGELQQAALVERAGQGRYRRSRPPTGGWEAMSRQH